MEEQIALVEKDDWSRDPQEWKITTYSTHASGPDSKVRWINSNQGWVAVKGLGYGEALAVAHAMAQVGFTVLHSRQDLDSLSKERDEARRVEDEARYTAYINTPEHKALDRLRKAQRPVAVSPTRTTINPILGKGEYFNVEQVHYLLAVDGKTRPVDVTSYGDMKSWDDAFAEGWSVELKHDQGMYSLGSARIVGIVRRGGAFDPSREILGAAEKRNYNHYVVK